MRSRAASSSSASARQTLAELAVRERLLCDSLDAWLLERGGSNGGQLATAVAEHQREARARGAALADYAAARGARTYERARTCARAVAQRSVHPRVLLRRQRRDVALARERLASPGYLRALVLLDGLAAAHATLSKALRGAAKQPYRAAA